MRVVWLSLRDRRLTPVNRTRRCPVHSEHHTTAESGMDCKSCGQTLADRASFCHACGAPAGSAAAAAVPEDSAPSVSPSTHGQQGLPKRTSKSKSPRHSPRSAAALVAKPRRGFGKPLLGLVVLALLGVSLWQWIDHDQGPTRPRTADTSRSARSAPTTARAPSPPSNPVYDVEGIEGIVDIETPEAVRTAPVAAVGEVARKLPKLTAQAAAGNPRAMTSLALTQRAGLAGRAEPQSAIALLQDAAAAGDADAMTALAEEYESGIWIKQDLQKARSLRQQAAQAGSRLAQWELEL